MKFTTLSRRTAAAGAASALVAGALVGATTTAAEAAPVTNTYSCTTSAGPQNVVVDVEVPGIGSVTALQAGQAVDPGGLLVANMTFTISNDFYELLGLLGVEEMEVPNYGADFGNSRVPVEPFSASVTDMEQNPDDSWSSSVSTAVEPFEAPSAGTRNVTTPSRFGIVATISGEPVDVECTRSDSAKILTTVEVSKNDSTTAAKAKNAPVAKGKMAKVGVTVKAPNETPGGKVILKKGKKTLDKANLDKKGKATLSYKAKKVGKNKLKVLYKGDGYTNTSSDKVTVKVVKN